MSLVNDLQVSTGIFREKNARFLINGDFHENFMRPKHILEQLNIMRIMKIQSTSLTAGRNITVDLFDVRQDVGQLDCSQCIRDCGRNYIELKKTESSNSEHIFQISILLLCSPIVIPGHFKCCTNQDSLPSRLTWADPNRCILHSRSLLASECTIAHFADSELIKSAPKTLQTMP